MQKGLLFCCSLPSLSLRKTVGFRSFFQVKRLTRSGSTFDVLLCHRSSLLFFHSDSLFQNVRESLAFFFQVKRQTCIEFTLFALLFLLVALRLEGLSNIHPTLFSLSRKDYYQTSCILRFFISTILWLAVSILQVNIRGTFGRPSSAQC